MHYRVLYDRSARKKRNSTEMTISRLLFVAQVYAHCVFYGVNVTSSLRHRSLSHPRSIRLADVLLILLHGCDHSECGWVLRNFRGDGQPKTPTVARFKRCGRHHSSTPLRFLARQSNTIRTRPGSDPSTVVPPC